MPGAAALALAAAFPALALVALAPIAASILSVAAVALAALAAGAYLARHGDAVVFTAAIAGAIGASGLALGVPYLWLLLGASGAPVGVVAARVGQRPTPAGAGALAGAVAGIALYAHDPVLAAVATAASAVPLAAAIVVLLRGATIGASG